MPDYRLNILTGNWVVVAEDRAARPGAFATPAAATQDEGPCPFCEGNEHETPHETFAVRGEDSEPDAPGWQVRMVPNRYPAVGCLHDHAGIEPSVWTDQLNADDLLSSRPAVGTHDVIVESPRHMTSLAELSADEMLCVVTSYRDRMRQLAARGDLACLLLFKNSGAGAGASLSHIHSQLIGLPQALPQIVASLARCRAYHEKNGRQLLDDWLDKELSDGSRVVRRTDNVVAVCPWASRFPAETWLVPQDGPACFEQLSDAQVASVASSLHDTLRRIEVATGGGPFNFLLHNPPAIQDADDVSRWHLEILPRLTYPGGFEWSTGMYINTVSPERAAACLRERRAVV